MPIIIEVIEPTSSTFVEVVAPIGTNVIEIAIPGIQGPGPSEAQINAIGTADNVPNSVARRDPSGGVEFTAVGLEGQPNAWSAVRKDYVDALGSTDISSLNNVVRRDGNGVASANRFYAAQSPTSGIELTRKDYVDEATRPVREATSEAEWLQIVRRDGAGHAKFSGVSLDSPTSGQAGHRAARKDYVDALGTQNPDANSIVRRDAAGSTVFYRAYSSDTTPTDPAQLIRKDYVDRLGSTEATPNTVMRRTVEGYGISTRFFSTEYQSELGHELTRKDYVDALGTAVAVNNSVVRRNQYGGAEFEAVDIKADTTQPHQATRKDYVDARVAALTSIAAAPPFIGKIAVVGTVAYVAVGTASASDWKQITN